MEKSLLMLQKEREHGSVHFINISYGTWRPSDCTWGWCYIPLFNSHKEREFLIKKLMRYDKRTSILWMENNAINVDTIQLWHERIVIYPEIPVYYEKLTSIGIYLDIKGIKSGNGKATIIEYK